MNQEVKILTTDEALNIIFNKRAWWKEAGLNESTARSHKKQFLAGKLQFETKYKILVAFGFEVETEMTWKIIK
jgi:hypothetical protein